MTELNVVKRLREIQRKVEELSQKQVVVGAIGGGDRDGKLTNADLLAIHEFGAVINHPGGTSYGKNSKGKTRFLSNSFIGPVRVDGVTGSHQIVIPERPVMRIALANNKQVIRNMLGRGVAECLRGNLSVDDVYNHVGNYLRGEVQSTFGSSELEPNKKSTIRKKKSSKPLVGHGALRNSISFEVRNRE